MISPPLPPPLTASTGFSRTRRPVARLRRFVGGVAKYGPYFSVEYAALYLTIFTFQVGADELSPGRIHLVLGMLIVLLALGAAEARHRLYRRVWKVAGLHDGRAVVFAVLEASLLVTAANGVLPPAHRPFGVLVPLAAAPAAAALIAGFRLLPRLMSRAPHPDNRLLIVVSDSHAYSTVKSLTQQQNPLWAPVAILTTSPEDIHRTVLGVPVVGRAEDLEHWVEVMKADGVAFVVNGVGSSELMPLFNECLRAQLPIFIVPIADELLRNGGPRLRQLSADDLVGRKVYQMGLGTAVPAIEGRRVLITGAAGSIGSELCRLVASMRPARVVLVDNNESGLFDIAEEIRANSAVDVRECLVSIVQNDQLLSVFADERPEIVFHAAAYKHVPMLEAHPEQAILVNVVGTRNTLRCAEAAGTSQFILISTDKAVARHSVMGCTKRLCELMVISYTGPVACWAVRFGNVVGSRGSVVPTFERQIEMGGPVTITHPDVERYMMTIREAVSLVISTLQLGRPGHLYMLNMGEPIKILSLAEALIRSRGLRPGADIDIVFTGLRAGERMTEDLLADDEGLRETAHPSVLEVISPSMPEDDLQWIVERLRDLAIERNTVEAVRMLKRVVAPRPRRAEPVPAEPSVVKTTRVGEAPILD